MGAPPLIGNVVIKVDTEKASVTVETMMIDVEKPEDDGAFLVAAVGVGLF